MSCIINAFNLFKTNACPATALAVMTFLLGMVAMCLVCKVCCPCGKKSCRKESKKPVSKKEEKPFEKRKPHPAPTDGSVEIYVGNLSYELTDDQLRKEFEAFGAVNAVRIVINRVTGKSKGYGFVNMPVRAEAEKAVAALNDKEIQGRKIRCNEAKNLI